MKPAYQIIDKILLTEKGSILSETQNQYLFQVHPDANKVEIAQAVEKLFGVKVDKVRTMNRIGKKKRVRTPNSGRTAATKRAVVTLVEGNTIDLT